MNKLLVSLLIVPVIAHGMAIKDKHFLLPEKLDGAKVYYDNDGFRVVKNNQTYNIPSYEVAKHLRHRSKAELKAYLKTGFLELKRMSDENYKIEGHQRGVGSGPILAYFFYFGTKSLAYGSIAAAGSAALVASGGVAGGAIGTALTLTTAAPTAMVAGTVGASAVATAGITSAIGAALAAGPLMIVAGIETLSLMAGAAGAAIPFL